MTGQLELELVVDRRHDLPPKWDGRVVTWRPRAGGAVASPGIVCQRSGPGRGCRPGWSCSACGHVGDLEVYVGALEPEPGATFEVDRTRRLPSGRSYTRTEEIPAYPLVGLVLNRCLECGHDTVTELEPETGEVVAAWELDESDYGDEGSRAP